MGEAGWAFFVIILPFLVIFVYLIAEGKRMGERSGRQAQAAMDSDVRSVASNGSGADQIAKAKALLDTGAITEAEFNELKAKALPG